MNTPAYKTPKNKRQSVANAISQKPARGEAAFPFVDNRPQSIAQRKIQEMADNSAQVRQLTAFQNITDNRSVHRQGIIQAYTIENPASVKSGTDFKSQSIKKGRYSRAYEESTKTAIKSQHHGQGDNADGVLHNSTEKQTGSIQSALGGLPSVKVSTNKKMAINNSGGQPKEFFAESAFINTANGKLKANDSKVLLKTEGNSIKVAHNATPLFRIVPAVPVPVSPENTDGLKEVFSHTAYKCDEFIQQVVSGTNRVISLLGTGDQPNVEVPTGMIGEPVEQIMDYVVNTDTEEASSEGLKTHTKELNRGGDYAYEQTAPSAYVDVDAEKRTAMSEKLGLNEHALPDVGEGYVIASRFSEDQMGGIMKTQTTDEYLESLEQLKTLNPNLDATQQEVESNVVRGMMRLWGSHYAAVVAKDGPDTITYENYNRETEVDWEVIEIFNALFEDFEEFRDFVGDKTAALNLNMDTDPAIQYITEARTALDEIEIEANSLRDRYKKALDEAKLSINSSLKSEAEDKRKLIYFQMYGPGEQSFHASFKGQTSNPMTMRIAPSIKIAQKSANSKFKNCCAKFKEVLSVPGTDTPWKEIFTPFFLRFINWKIEKAEIINAGADYKTMIEVEKTLEPGFNAWNNDLRIEIVNKVKQLVGDHTLPAPTSKQDVLDTINTQLVAHEVSSFDFTQEGYRKDAIHKQLEILGLGAVNLK